MGKLFVWIGIIGLAWTLPAWAGFSYVNRCGGGEGPHPLINFSQDFPAKWIETEASVQDFSFSEKRDELLYRTTSNNVKAYYHSDGSKAEMGYSRYPLSQVIDEDLGLLAAQGFPAYSDFDPFGWKVFNVRPTRGGYQNLFWEKGTLYSLKRRSSDHYDIYQYRKGAASSQPHCWTSNLYPAEGHAYPYVYYYGQESDYYGIHLVVYTVDVRSCQIVHELEFGEPLAGRLQEVHVFPSLKAVAVKVDHPETNLLWYQSVQGCAYYNLNATPNSGSRLMVLNHENSLLGSFSLRDGLSLIDFSAQSRTRVPAFLQAKAMRGAYLTRDGRRLYLNPEANGEGPHPLLELTLPSH